MELNLQNVSAVVQDCLFRDNELVGGGPPDDAVIAKGLATNMGFHPDRLESQRENILSMIGELPDTFFEETGGGWSFLNLPTRKDGSLWGEQRDAEVLFLLGLAIGKMRYLIEDRETWKSMPGGVPYVVVLKGEKN